MEPVDRARRHDLVAVRPQPGAHVEDDRVVVVGLDGHARRVAAVALVTLHPRTVWSRARRGNGLSAPQAQDEDTDFPGLDKRMQAAAR